MPLSWRDRVLLAGLRAVPARIARHLMFLLHSQPATADALGYHVRPIHFYEPLPDFRAISPGALARRRVSSAIDFDVDGQERLMARLAPAFAAELQEADFDFSNPYFSGLDAAIYYALIRDLVPARVIEIGAGMSTRIAALALERNKRLGRGSELVCIEPFPEARLTDNMPDARLIQQRVEEVPLEQFDSLGANDILFIDSSHAVKFGGDVCREFLEILPRLKPGVWVHVHDVFLPKDYPAEWVVNRRLAFNEQYLLEAFLAFNRAYATRVCLHWLWTEHGGAIRTAWPSRVIDGAEQHSPSSFWMTRVG